MTTDDDDKWVIIGPNGATEFTGDIFAEMARQEEAANQRTTDAQRMIGTEGHHWWVRIDHPFLIFGHVPLISDTIAKERSYYPQVMEDEDQQEYDSIVAGMHERWRRGYRFGRAFSIVEPEGELGDTHVSEMIEITADEFDAARRSGFDGETLMVEAGKGDAVAHGLLQRLLREASKKGE